MKERPILFSAPMVRAILAGRKTQTRRGVKRLAGLGPVTEFQRSDTAGYDWSMRDRSMLWHDFRHVAFIDRCPYGRVGDVLWVRESFQPLAAEDMFLDDFRIRCDYKTGKGYKINYPATDGIVEYVDMDDNLSDACVSSIHMPRWASRITLEVTSVRVERLQSISEEDALAEGVERDSDGWFDYLMPNTQTCASSIDSYRTLWESINGAGSWDANPWVWAISFRVVKP